MLVGFDHAFSNESENKKAGGSEEAQHIMEAGLEDETLTPDKLRELLKCEDLKRVRSARLKLCSKTQSLDTLGELLPNLRELKLSGSQVASFRDLGQSARSLEVLWLSDCGLKDLDGVDNMVSLKELYASFNEIEDVSPLYMHPSLEVLDLDNNKITSTGDIDFIASLKNLRVLSLRGNQISLYKHYRNIVCSRIPQLESLEDKSVRSKEKKNFREKYGA